MLRSTITELNFNPVWHLPPTVIEEDLIPKGQEMAAQRPERAREVRHRRLRRRARSSIPTRSTGARGRCQGSPIASSRERKTRSASSRSTSHNSQFRLHARHARRSRCSGAISARPARAACACRASRSSPRGCWPDQGWRRSRSQHMKETGQTQDGAAEEAGAAVFRLCHGLGDARTASIQFRPRPLPKGRRRRDRCGILSLRAAAIDRHQGLSARRSRNFCARSCDCRRDNRHVARNVSLADDDNEKLA